MTRTGFLAAAGARILAARRFRRGTSPHRRDTRGQRRKPRVSAHARGPQCIVRCPVRLYPHRMGPLAGIKIIEFAGIGPCPMAAMMLAEMGATVLRIDRVADSDLGLPLPTRFEVLKRSRHIIHLDLKRQEAVALTLRLIEQSDAV